MRLGRVCLFILTSLFAGLYLAGCGGESETQSTPLPQAHLPDFTGLVKSTAPAVVNISIFPGDDDGEDAGDSAGPANPLEDFFKRFFDEEGPPSPPQQGPRGLPQPSLGSGFIISEDGYILTNKHVVREAGQILVKLSDRRQLVAEVVGSDDYSDVALLKVDADDLPAVKIGDVSELEVGSWVVAIGSPFGFETSVTAGIVSAKRRSLADDQYVPFIQTDVAINPGNSGGPLFNLKGEVVGVNAQIYSRTGGYQGVSFAIPIDVAMDVADQLREDGEVARGWLGVQIQEVDRQLAESFGMERPEGALVARVLPGSPAEAAGFHEGDVIVAFDGKRVASASALPPIVGLTAPEETVPVTILRDGERQTLDVMVGKLDRDGPIAQRESGDEETPRKSAVLGLRLRDLSDAERSELDIESGGVRIEEVGEGPGREAGLRPGDVVLAVGSDRVASAAALRKRLQKADKPLALLIRRNGNPMFLALDPDA